MIKKFIIYFFEYIVGKIISPFLYEKKYVRGKYFEFGKRGWKWVYNDFKARLFLNVNRNVPFPISVANRVNTPENILFDPGNLHIFQGSGKYFQAEDAKIILGDNCYIANNVGIITTNHNLLFPEKHLPGRDIYIGSNCWIGMNSIILPGIVLGEHTVVGAGSVVTKSFPEGNCVIAGNPAKFIKKNN